MVRHTPAFVFVHRFAIGTATGSSFSPSPRGDGRVPSTSTVNVLRQPSPLGEGWPKAGVCRTRITF